MLGNRRIWMIATPVFVILIASAAWICFPALRLMAHAGRIRTIPKTEEQWVNAHRYDSEWFDAARAGRVDILQALYEAHYPIDSQTAAGYSALTLAAYDEQPDALGYLLSAGANACLGDRNGNTALMGALYKGNTDVVRILIHQRCPVDQSNNAGETALSFAALFGRKEFLPELIREGARIDHRDAKGQTALAIAMKQGNDSMAITLRNLGAKD